MTNDSAAATLTAILFSAGGAHYVGADGATLPAPPRAAAVTVAALWERPSPN